MIEAEKASVCCWKQRNGRVSFVVCQFERPSLRWIWIDLKLKFHKKCQICQGERKLIDRSSRLSPRVLRSSASRRKLRTNWPILRFKKLGQNYNCKYPKKSENTWDDLFKLCSDLKRAIFVSYSPRICFIFIEDMYIFALFQFVIPANFLKRIIHNTTDHVHMTLLEKIGEIIVLSDKRHIRKYKFVCYG